MNKKVIEVDNINYKYPDGYRAIKDVSFYVREGEKLGIIGANGAGKSTMLKLLIGILTAENGRIIVNDILLNKKNLKEIRKKVGFVFQESDNQLFMNTVYNDIAFGLRSGKLDEENINLKIDKILEEIKIERLRNKQIYKLSGGEKKVVAIAGIIVMNPEIILMDEVTASLDPKSRRTVINLITDLKETIVIASHDLDMILDVCDRVLVFSNGEIIQEGSSYSILSNEKIMEESNLELPLSLIKK
ncbi:MULTISPECIES: ABC transporter ATP-binding protein [Clostridium]|uniref:energy-coupling factor ABC transporter ATP-binding protein n=1 Tax=Clostridium TaxID=1485 RepID=UPI001899367E|nr:MULTISPECIES: ABC transporter ATP-binding protein [Clostridium]MDI9218445.1 energy-coupling factor ABC transporter ATP-binding protein [Clostridium tertium]